MPGSSATSNSATVIFAAAATIPSCALRRSLRYFPKEKSGIDPMGNYPMAGTTFHFSRALGRSLRYFPMQNQRFTRSQPRPSDETMKPPCICRVQTVAEF
jgi:hypothetical protein